MARKTLRLTKRGFFAIVIAVLVVALLLLVIFNQDSSEDTIKKEETNVEISNVVAENQVLKVELLELVNERNYLESYQEVIMRIEKGEKVLGYKIARNQSFNKVMQLLPPGEDAPLLNHSSQKPSHEAYILVLTGDIVEYQNQDGKKTYQIVNGQLSYYQQSLLLESEYNSVYIASIDGKKEKMVNLDDYQKALASSNERSELLTANYQGRKTYVRTADARLRVAGQVMRVK